MEGPLIVSQLAGLTADTGAGGGLGSSPALSPPDDPSVSRFRRAMGQVLPGDDLVGPADLPIGAGAGDLAANRLPQQRHIGEAILSGLGALSNDLQRAWNNLRAPAGVAVPGPAESWVQPGQPAASATDALRRHGGPAQEGAPPGSVPAAPTAPGSLSDLLTMQKSMIEFSFRFEALGKGTSKFIDNTNQLVKMQ